ncbi:hypothetical protein BJX99DRAFT_254907 [Aspergillus californicus]
MLTHRALPAHPAQGSWLHIFNALPSYHLYGVSASLQAIPEVVHTPLYVLGLMAERQKGVELLKKCQVVIVAGARTLDERGARLVQAGVKLEVVFGTVTTKLRLGLAGDTMRTVQGDGLWNYIRIYANIRESIDMRSIGDDLYESVYFRVYPALFTFDSDDSACGEWHSKDVFTPHSTIPDRIEGCIRKGDTVGVDRTIPGLLIFRASAGGGISEAGYLDAVWPSIVSANSQAEGFSQITRESVTLIPSDVECPQTDKKSIIRAQVNRQFSEEIEAMYTRLDSERERTYFSSTCLPWKILQTIFQSITGMSLVSLETDFSLPGRAA